MPPGSLAATDDLVELCRVVAPYGGIYSTHIRNEGTGVFDAVKEAIKKPFRETSPGRPKKEELVYGEANIAHPADANVVIRKDQLLDWAKAGMNLAHESYRRLVADLQSHERDTVVILLYTPSSYEVYRDLLLERNRAYDEISEFQVNAQRSFAE